MLALSLALALLVGRATQSAGGTPAPPPDPVAPLAIYDGTWTVQAEHPWGGGKQGTEDRLVSRCSRLTRYFVCEQTVNGTTQALIVYTAGESAGHLHTRFIDPAGLSSGRGDLTIAADHWTYLDKPQPGLKGPWSRVENTILDHDHIRFEEYESADQGKTWTKVNGGVETRVR